MGGNDHLLSSIKKIHTNQKSLSVNQLFLLQFTLTAIAETLDVCKPTRFPGFTPRLSRLSTHACFIFRRSGKCVAAL